MAEGAAVPTLDAAERAARVLLDAGVTTVLLYGSLARDEPEPADIDLVAIYDDLDYAQRRIRRSELIASASEAAGCPVDVFVTDFPEWRTRTRKVPASLEAHISTYAVCVGRADSAARIDWDKEIGLPSTPAAELESRFIDMSDAVTRLGDRLRPSRREADAAGRADLAILDAEEDVRFASACSDVHMVIEAAAKVTHVLTVKARPPRDHAITRLIESQPGWVRKGFADAASGNVDLSQLHLWRQGGTYAADRPEASFDEVYLRRHASAALGIARFAADRCRPEGIDAGAFRIFEFRLEDCEAALSEPLRLHRDA